MVDGLEQFVDELHLPDPDDRHVLAAALASGARTIVTANLRHFPVNDLLKYETEAISPDQLLVNMLDTEPGTVLQALHSQAEQYRRPSMDLIGLLACLDRAGASTFAERIRKTLLLTVAEEVAGQCHVDEHDR